MKRKWLAIGIILLFVGVTIAPAMAQVNEKFQSTTRGNWLYVGGSGPGNYTRIQDAIDNACDGDTVFVYDDSSPYYEKIFIDKSIHVLGENKNTTVIDDMPFGGGNAVLISADNVSLQEFTINKLNGYGPSCVYIQANYSLVSNNIIKGFNILTGISLLNSYNTTIFCNRVSNNYNGIQIDNSHNNNIFENIINNNYIGLELFYSSSNFIYHNYFIDNLDDALAGSESNTWNYDYLSGGNYWFDWNGRDDFWGPNQDINGSDGIIDSPMYINEHGNCDYYPLKYPYGQTQLSGQLTPKTMGSKILVKNFRSTTAFDVHWTLTLNGGKLICPREYSGIIKPILPNETIAILPGFFFFGLGTIEINTTVWAENAPIFTEEINGFLFLFFFSVKRVIYKYDTI